MVSISSDEKESLLHLSAGRSASSSSHMGLTVFFSVIGMVLASMEGESKTPTLLLN